MATIGDFFKFTICSNKRFSARRAGFRKSKRPIFVDDRSTDALLFYLASGKSGAFFNNNFDAIFWVPFLQVHFYTRLERERERIEYKYKDYLHTTEYECRRRRRKHEPAFGTVSSRPLFVLRLLDVLNDDD